VPCEVRFPIREIGLVIQSHLSWWFASAPGCAFVRSDGGPAGSCGVGSLSFRRSDGWWPSSAARAFSGITVSDAIDMLLLVPIKNYVQSERGLASICGRLLRSPATSMTGQGSGCNFYFLRECLCKIWYADHQKNI